MPDEERSANGADPLPEDAAVAETPDPEEQLEVVFSTNDDSEALVVRALLESNGLEVAMSTPEAPIGVFPISSSDLGRVQLMVRAEAAADALRIIEESSRRGPQDAEEAERQTEGEQP